MLNDVFAVPEVSEKNDNPSIKLTSAKYPSKEATVPVSIAPTCIGKDVLFIGVSKS